MITLAVKAMSNSGSDCNTYDRKQGNCYGRRLVGGGTPCVNNYVNVCHFTDSVDVVVSNGASGLIAQMVSSRFALTHLFSMSRYMSLIFTTLL